MTVPAQDLKVLQPIVKSVPVLVVQLKAERPASPLRDAACFASLLFESSRKESSFQVRSIRIAPDNEEVLKRDPGRGRYNVSSLDRAIPRIAAKPESLETSAHAQTFFVDRALDFLPVVSAGESWIGTGARACARDTPQLTSLGRVRGQSRPAIGLARAGLRPNHGTSAAALRSRAAAGPARPG
jgi:hypothetical protein